MSKTYSLQAIELFLDGNRGIYLPHDFAEAVELNKFDGIDSDDIKTLLEGPDNLSYWETWDDVLQNAVYQENGMVWRLHQDDDLFLLCDELMTPEERENFYGPEWSDD